MAARGDLAGLMAEISDALGDRSPRSADLHRRAAVRLVDGVSHTFRHVEPFAPRIVSAELDDNTVAATLETWFQFTHPCGDTDCPAQWVWDNPNTLGATVVATNSTSDFTLLQLSEDPPGGSVFLGWSTEAVAYAEGTDLYRISHPSGAPQAYSHHKVWDPPVECTGWSRGEWIYHQDQTGATEGGSSGSPVVNASGQIVGQLSGACGYNTGDVCVTGSTDQLTNWGNGVLMAPGSNPELFEVCVTWPAGTPVQDIEYKFRKDGCETWESVGNRTFAIDNSLDPETTLTFGWDDLGGECAPVSTQPSTWGSIKGQYR